MPPAIGRTAILLSTYNGERYLQECLQSLYDQDYGDLTLVVRDDGSIDRSMEILKQEKEHSRIPMILLESGENFGPAKSFFRLLGAQDDFDYYAFCDQDDVWLKDKISRALTKMKDVDKAIPSLYCSRVEYVNEKLNHVQWSRIPRRIGYGNALVENIATGCTIVINKALRQLIIDHLPLQCLMHDWWCYLTAACFGCVIYDDQSRIKYRLHGNNKIGAPTTFIEDATQRVKRFFKGEGGIFRSSDQAGIFLQCFGKRMGEESYKITAQMVNCKASLPERIALAGSGYLWRQRKMDDLILKGLIVINRF
jgi:glycosyltransferase involved in cell wall biosynthesis